MEKVIAGSVSKYRQILQILRTQILSGALSAGQRLPTEEELGQTYGVSRGTVRKAVEQLCAEGLVRTEQGSGSYVSTAHPNAVPFRFTGCAPAVSPAFRVITREVIPAPMLVAERLIVPLGEPLIHIARLRMHGEEIVGFSERFLPRSLCPGLLGEDLEQPSIHDILVGRSELPLLRATIEIEAQMLDEEGANQLHVPPATPAIVISRMTYTAPNRPAVWYRGLYRQTYCVGVRVDALGAEQHGLPECVKEGFAIERNSK